MKREFEALMKDTLDSLGKTNDGLATKIAEYMDERMEHLAKIAEEPGFGEAVIAERVAIAIKAGIETSRAASIVDQRILGVISGALRIGVLALI